LAKSQTKVAGSTQRPSPFTSQAIAIGAAPRPSGAIGSENRSVKRVMAEPSVPGVAVTTVGEVSAEAVIGTKASKAATRYSQPRIPHLLDGAMMHE
jgi:hypothetical protein